MIIIERADDFQGKLEKDLKKLWARQIENFKMANLTIKNWFSSLDQKKL